ncbi:hypothetical protein Tco_0852222 [Tanacetum coccineum]
MANENVPVPAPTRSDDQTYLRAMGAYWKEQLCLGSSKEAKESNLLDLYTLNMREALEITPIDQAHQFVSPPSGDAIMDFVNDSLLKTQSASKTLCLATLAEEISVWNISVVPKGEKDEVFRMQIPNVLITDSIRNAPYYEAYLGIVANIGAENKGKKRSTSKADPSKKPATAKQLKPKPVKEKSSKPAP